MADDELLRTLGAVSLGVAPVLLLQHVAVVEPQAVVGTHGTGFAAPFIAGAYVGALAVLRRRPTWGPAVTMAMVLAMAVLTDGLAGGLTVALLSWVPTALWAVVLGVTEPWTTPLLSRRALVGATPGAAVAVVAWWEQAPAWLVVAAAVVAVVGIVLALVVHPAGEIADGAPRRLRSWVTAAVRGSRQAAAWWAAPRPSRVSFGSVEDAHGRVVDYLWPVVAWFGSALVATKVMFVASPWWGGEPVDWSGLLGVDLLDQTGKVGWGTGDYWHIATEGYDGSVASVASFPGLALAQRFLGRWAGSVMDAGVIITVVSGLVAVVLMWRWMRGRGVPVGDRRVATLLVVLSPYAFLFSGVAYSDVLLLALLMAVWVLIDGDHPVLAGLVGAAATATRPNALPVIIALVVIVCARARVFDVERPTTSADPSDRRHLDVATPFGLRRVTAHVRRLRPAQLGVLLSAGGVLAYASWLWTVEGSPIAFLSAQADYGHAPVLSLATWTKAGFLQSPGNFVQHWVEIVNEVLSLAMFVITAIAVRPITRRFGVGYGVFVVCELVIAWIGPQGFAPGARLLMPTLPFVAAVAAPWLRRRPTMLWPTLACSGGLFLLFAWCFPAGGLLWGEW